ncbi:pirin family protein [Thalassorhabdus alkalitolerans]|uniref:Pirin family protein n=1 Tax=Thalassorhabdus alkalitolerans TaxID=2282697 RepID=A0ABW0YLJ7_9BACI
MERKINKVWSVTHRQQGENHKQGWVLEPGNWAEFDPFLLMAEDWFKKGTFGFHPHRGMETVTYVIDGELEHKDNKGGQGVLKGGDVQWMTAGSGIIHAEEPVEGSTVHSLQLWVNLPSSEKMTEPRYQDLYQKDMPVIEEDGVKIRVFSGTYKGQKASTKNHVPITMLELEIDEYAKAAPEIPASYNGFLFILEGKGTFGKDKTTGGKGDVLLLEQAGERTGESTAVSMESKGEKLKVLLYAGEPVKEPIAAQGPFVMNTHEEIKQAFDDYRNGKF